MTAVWGPTGYTPDQRVDTVFIIPANLSTLGDASLLQALGFQGGQGGSGSARVLLRAGVAALLNASHPDINYPLSGAQVISQVNSALASLNRSTMLTLASKLDAFNNVGCTVDADGNVIVRDEVGDTVITVRALEGATPAATAVTRPPSTPTPGFGGAVLPESMTTPTAPVKTLPTAGGGSGASYFPWGLTVSLALALAGLAFLYGGLRLGPQQPQPASGLPDEREPAAHDTPALLRAFLEKASDELKRAAVELERIRAELEETRHNGARRPDGRRNRPERP